MQMDIDPQYKAFQLLIQVLTINKIKMDEIRDKVEDFLNKMIVEYSIDCVKLKPKEEEEIMKEKENKVKEKENKEEVEPVNQIVVQPVKKLRGISRLSQLIKPQKNDCKKEKKTEPVTEIKSVAEIKPAEKKSDTSNSLTYSLIVQNIENKKTKTIAKDDDKKNENVDKAVLKGQIMIHRQQTCKMMVSETKSANDKKNDWWSLSKESESEDITLCSEKKHPICKKGAHCDNYDEHHNKQYLHPPNCSITFKCQDRSNEHQNNFRHQLCPYGAICKNRDEEHNREHKHPKQCKYDPNCTNRNPEHQKHFGHKQRCVHGSNCRYINLVNHNRLYFHEVQRQWYDQY